MHRTGGVPTPCPLLFLVLPPLPHVGDQEAREGLLALQAWFSAHWQPPEARGGRCSGSEGSQGLAASQSREGRATLQAVKDRGGEVRAHGRPWSAAGCVLMSLNSSPTAACRLPGGRPPGGLIGSQRLQGPSSVPLLLGARARRPAPACAERNGFTPQLLPRRAQQPAPRRGSHQPRPPSPAPLLGRNWPICDLVSP